MTEPLGAQDTEQAMNARIADGKEAWQLAKLKIAAEKAVIALQQIAMAHPTGSEHATEIYQLAEDARQALLTAIREESWAG